MVMQEQGEDSEQYKFLIPDTVKFNAWYGFPFSFLIGSSIKTVKLQETLPMVAISYEQAMAYCQWIETAIFNKHDSTRIWQCSLPTKADYEMVFKKAKITQRESLSSLQRRKCNRALGLTDNVAEYTQDGMVVEGGESIELKFVKTEECENPIGFRCKVIIVSKK